MLNYLICYVKIMSVKLIDAYDTENVNKKNNENTCLAYMSARRIVSILI